MIVEVYANSTRKVYANEFKRDLLPIRNGKYGFTRSFLHNVLMEFDSVTIVTAQTMLISVGFNSMERKHFVRISQYPYQAIYCN